MPKARMVGTSPIQILASVLGVESASALSDWNVLWLGDGFIFGVVLGVEAK